MGFQRAPVLTEAGQLFAGTFISHEGSRPARLSRKRAWGQFQRETFLRSSKLTSAVFITISICENHKAGEHPRACGLR